MNQYPTIFVHGFLGWGTEDNLEDTVHYWGAKKNRDLLQQLREEGFEVYAPAVGPFNGAWDRACELYARLFGGTVDYGKVHSEKYGHQRFGRTYEGCLPDLGQPGNHAKINLVGHSFGGPTVRMFAYLLAYGSEEEREGTPEDELSGLFKGDKASLVHTVTTLSGVNNGTTYDDLHGEKGMEVMTRAILDHVVRLGDSDYMSIKDYHMEQWDLMEVPEETEKKTLRLPIQSRDEIHGFLDNELDNIGYEMSTEGMQKINEIIKTSDNIYYFARRACRTHWDNKHKNHIPDENISAFCRLPATLSGRHHDSSLEKYGYPADAWLPNDGFVNVLGLSAPFNAPQEEWTMLTTLRPGIWYNMPVEDKDHMSWMGFGEKDDVLLRYYRDMLTLFANLPDGTVA